MVFRDNPTITQRDVPNTLLHRAHDCETCIREDLSHEDVMTDAYLSISVML